MFKEGKVAPEKGELEEKVGNEASPLEECIDCWKVGCWTGLISWEESVVAR